MDGNVRAWYDPAAVLVDEYGTTIENPADLEEIQGVNNPNDASIIGGDNSFYLKENQLVVQRERWSALADVAEHNRLRKALMVVARSMTAPNVLMNAARPRTFD